MRVAARAGCRLALVAAVVLARVAAGASPAFESDVVRPLALSPDGSRLFAVNTPDARLEILRVTAGGLAPEASVPVGLEPVAVAVRSSTEVWVVNHLSDSVSVVDVGAVPPRVARTLWVGDEPRDIVFAGAGHARAFVTTAHRGQNSPVDPAPFSGGVGRADVWVFDADTAGGQPLAVLSLFGDTPRALAVTPDGATVYAAVYRSGNQTTTVGFGSVCPGGEHATCEVDGVPMPGGLPAPNSNVFVEFQPDVGLIVRFDPGTGAWRDQIGRDWRDAVRFTLPDLDVFAIDALATPPAPTVTWAHVGTILFNMAVNPASGRVYVSNTEARNERRFAGLGTFAGTSVRGRLHEARITVLEPGGVLPRHLNKHIDYDVVPSPPGVAERSLAQPMGMAVSADGATLYVAALGSDAVGVFATAALEADTFVPDAAAQVPVSGGGPTGLVLDDGRGRLYVATRFDDGVSVVDTGSKAEIAHLRLHDPEPAALVAGRRFFYDARLTSSNGEASCAVCHLFGDVDGLAWDLGDPDLPVVANPNPTREGVDNFGFRPMKGPMTTQTFRGIATQGPMHWRGDRTGALVPGGDAFDERAALRQFNEAFVGLLGRAAPLAADQLERLIDFGLAISPQPNPHRALDGTLTAIQSEGETSFLHVQDPCAHCHVVDPARGAFGTDGRSAPTDGGIQFFLKIPPLHSAYQKVGLFEMRPPFNNDDDTSPVGPQVRGFGYLHEGSQGFPPSASPALLEFVFAFPGPLAPIVGQQVSLSGSDDAVASGRAALLAARAAAGECDLVVHGVQRGEMRGWLRGADGRFQADRAAAAPLAEAELRAGASAGTARSYTCVPPGAGLRLALDRDEDGAFDGDERLRGTDPADPASRPAACTGTLTKARLRTAPDGAGGVRFTLQGVLLVPAPLDPAVDGIAAHVLGAGDAIVLTSAAPDGAGWRTTTRGWTFAGAAGVRRVTMRRTPAGVAVRVQGTTASLDVLPSDLPPRFTLGVGPQCATVDFTRCVLASGNARLICR
jgi:DNA-binding beta-propeller fold protein YncE